MITVRREERLVTLLVDCEWRESFVADYQNDSVYERQQSPLVRESSLAFSSSDGDNYAYTSSEYNESPNFVHLPDSRDSGAFDYPSRSPNPKQHFIDHGASSVNYPQRYVPPHLPILYPSNSNSVGEMPLHLFPQREERSFRTANAHYAPYPASSHDPLGRDASAFPLSKAFPSSQEYYRPYPQYGPGSLHPHAANPSPAYAYPVYADAYPAEVYDEYPAEVYGEYPESRVGALRRVRTPDASRRPHVAASLPSQYAVLNSPRSRTPPHALVRTPSRAVVRMGPNGSPLAESVRFAKSVSPPRYNSAVDRTDWMDRGDLLDSNSRVDRLDRVDRSDHFDQSDRFDRFDRYDRPDQDIKHTRFNRADRSDRASRGDGPSLTPFLTLPLWDIALYSQLRRDGALKLVEAETVPRPSEAQLKAAMDEAIESKRQGFLNRARAAFLELSCRCAWSVQVWLEFGRLELECGDFRSAQRVLLSGLAYHPQSDLLLQKLLRVDEKLRDVASLRATVNKLITANTQKSLRVAVEGVLAAARLGYRQYAHLLFDTITRCHRYALGVFYLQWLYFDRRCGPYAALLPRCQSLLRRFARYGPLWFEYLDLLEHDFTLNLRRGVAQRCVDVAAYEEAVARALGSLTSDVAWRVHFTAVLFLHRVLILVREAAAVNVGAFRRLDA